MDDPITKDTVRMFKLRFKNSHDFNADFSGVGIETVIALNMFWHIVPVVTIKQYSHFKMRNVGIGNEPAQFILLNVIKAHCIEQGVAKRFKTVFTRVFKGTFKGTTFHTLSYIGRLNLLIFATIETRKSYPVTFFVVGNTLIGAIISLANLAGNFVSHLSAAMARNLFSGLSFFAALFGRISGSTDAGTIIPLTVLNKVTLLVKLFTAMVTRYQLAVKFGIARASTTNTPALPRAKHNNFSAFSGTLKFFTAILANKRSNHTDIIAQEGTFCNV